MYCPRCFGDTKQLCDGHQNGIIWHRHMCTECHTQFTMEEKLIDWSKESNKQIVGQRNLALSGLRRLGVTVREIALYVGLSENYVGQITKHVNGG